nr:helix-turn-helix domain-containing protein [Catenuloplanes japonicus]
MGGVSTIDAFVESLEASGLPPLLSRKHGGEAFRAGVVTGDLGPLRFAELRTPAGECFRDARIARGDDGGTWQLYLLTRGRVRAEQGRSVAVLEPSDLVLIDPARPVQFAGTETTNVTVLVPRASLRLHADEAARLAGVRIRGDRGPGALVSALVKDMVRSATGFRAAEAARSAAAITELISVALSAQLGDLRLAPDDALRSRIEGYIEARLSDPDLSPAKIAKNHHLSVRRLHRLFEDQPLTVAALIRRRRLERCHADLAAPGRTVASVAARWGFSDPAHFSRLFKATFGYTASRAAADQRQEDLVHDLGQDPVRDGRDAPRRVLGA